MYTGLVCLVLFDARGDGSVESVMFYGVFSTCLALVILAMTYIPYIFNRPVLVDSLCADLLSMTVHMACISMLSDPYLRHACALNSLCFCIQNRFIGVKSTVQPILLHSILVSVLLFSYVYGPRITEVRHFVIGAACPHVLELGANVLVCLHGISVSFFSEVGT